MEDIKKRIIEKKLDLVSLKMDLYEKNAKRRQFFRAVFGVMLTIMVAASLAFLLFTEIPEGNREVVISLVAGLNGAFFGTVMGYYFGDSDKSSDQVPQFREQFDDTLEESEDMVAQIDQEDLEDN